MSEAAVRKWDEDARTSAAPLSAPKRARIRRLTVTDFRSYARADIAFDGRPAAISGPNGAGKTNILEAISLIGPGRGVRGAKLDELPRIGGAGGWAVSARVDDGEDERRFGVGAAADNPARRVCRIDDRDASGPGVFADHLRFLWLTPAQDRLFMEAAGDRRRFLDRMTLAHDPAHGRRSGAYEQAMRQRQRLLDEGGRDESWLDAVERQMAEAGAAIAAARRAMVSRLMAAEVTSENGVFPDADIALDGELETALERHDLDQVESDFAETLRARRWWNSFPTPAPRRRGGARACRAPSQRSSRRPSRQGKTGAAVFDRRAESAADRAGARQRPRPLAQRSGCAADPVA